MPKKLLIKKTHLLFSSIKNHPYYQRIHSFPLYQKIFLSIIFFFLGVMGVIFPILPGSIFIILALVLILGIHTVKKYSLKTIYLTRIHIIFSRLYLWWKNR